LRLHESCDSFKLAYCRCSLWLSNLFGHDSTTLEAQLSIGMRAMKPSWMALLLVESMEDLVHVKTLITKLAKERKERNSSDAWDAALPCDLVFRSITIDCKATDWSLVRPALHPPASYFLLTPQPLYLMFEFWLVVLVPSATKNTIRRRTIFALIIVHGFEEPWPHPAPSDLFQPSRYSHSYIHCDALISPRLLAIVSPLITKRC